MRKFFLTIALLLALDASGAHALAPPDVSADESFKEFSTTDGKKFIEKLRANLEALNDYSVDSDLFMYKPTAERVAGGNLRWMRINLLRLTVKSKGLKDGSIVVRGADGTIKACGGPHLRFLKMTLTEDSRILQTPNGYNALKSDLGNLLSKVSESLASGSKARVTAQPVQVPRLKQAVYVLQVLKPAPSGDVISEQIFIDPSKNIPIEWDIFKSGVRYSVATFENFQGNIGLEDSEFQI